jgi:hypothetical protein
MGEPMSIEGAEQDGGSAPDRAMLKLPLRGRTGCSWVPLAVVGLVVVVAVVGSGYWFGWMRPPAAPAPDATLPAAEAAVVAVTRTATPKPTPALLPTASPTPTLVPTWTLVPTRTPEPLPTASPTVGATATAAATATATLTPTPTQPAPSPTEVAMPEAVPCDASLLAAIEGAAEAQAAYMEGNLDEVGLADAWGGAAADAQTQAERMMAYRASDITGVEVTEVEWTVNSCAARAYRGWTQVAVSEEWRYTAELTCASGDVETSTWIEAFSSELYALVPVPGGWRIESWLSGRPDRVARWHCSGTQ